MFNMYIICYIVLYLSLFKFIQITFTIFYNYSYLRASILGYKSSKMLWSLPYMLLIWLWYNRISSLTWILIPVLLLTRYLNCRHNIHFIELFSFSSYSTIFKQCLARYPIHIAVVHKMFVLPQNVTEVEMVVYSCTYRQSES